MNHALHIKIAPRRMLTKREAADYCGMSHARFPALCNCVPVQMPNKELMYDIKDLDLWLDSLKTNGPDSDEAIIGKLGNDIRAA